MSALIIVVVIGAASILMAKGAAFLSIGELDMGRTASSANSGYYQAESCLEEALLRLKREPDFAASGLRLAVGNGECIVNVSGATEEKTIELNGLVGNYQQNLQAIAETDGRNVILKTVNFQ